MKQTSVLILLIAAITGFSSCKKQLDLLPTDTFNEDNSFLTIEDIQLGVNEAYGRYGAYANDMYVSALVSDEAKMGSGNSGQGALTFRYQYGSNSTSGGDVIQAWSDYYAMIDQINRVLPHISSITVAPSDTARLQVLKGQLLALRAIGHFGLLQSYSNNYDPADPLGVPVMLTSDLLGQPARNTMGEVMGQIQSDLAD